MSEITTYLNDQASSLRRLAGRQFPDGSAMPPTMEETADRLRAEREAEIDAACEPLDIPEIVSSPEEATEWLLKLDGVTSVQVMAFCDTAKGGRQDFHAKIAVHGLTFDTKYEAFTNLSDAFWMAVNDIEGRRLTRNAVKPAASVRKVCVA